MDDDDDCVVIINRIHKKKNSKKLRSGSALFGGDEDSSSGSNSGSKSDGSDELSCVKIKMDDDFDDDFEEDDTIQDPRFLPQFIVGNGDGSEDDETREMMDKFEQLSLMETTEAVVKIQVWFRYVRKFRPLFRQSQQIKRQKIANAKKLYQDIKSGKSVANDTDVDVGKLMSVGEITKIWAERIKSITMETSLIAIVRGTEREFMQCVSKIKDFSNMLLNLNSDPSSTPFYASQLLNEAIDNENDRAMTKKERLVALMKNQASPPTATSMIEDSSSLCLSSPTTLAATTIMDISNVSLSSPLSQEFSQEFSQEEPKSLKIFNTQAVTSSVLTPESKKEIDKLFDDSDSSPLQQQQEYEQDQQEQKEKDDDDDDDEEPSPTMKKLAMKRRKSVMVKRSRMSISPKAYGEIENQNITRIGVTWQDNVTNDGIESFPAMLSTPSHRVSKPKKSILKAATLLNVIRK